MKFLFFGYKKVELPLDYIDTSILTGQSPIRTGCEVFSTFRLRKDTIAKEINLMSNEITINQKGFFIFSYFFSGDMDILLCVVNKGV